MMRIISSSFRLGLVFLSVLCSLLFLSDNLDRPNLEIVRAQEIGREQTIFKHELERIENDKTQSLDHLNKQQHAELQSLASTFDKRIKELEKALRKEMDNVINGTFKEPRYAEFKRQVIMRKGNTF